MKVMIKPQSKKHNIMWNLLEKSILIISLLFIIQYISELILPNDREITIFQEIFEQVMVKPFAGKKEKCSECWCIPDGGPDSICPELGKRKLQYDSHDISKFKSFQLTLTPSEELPKLIPVGIDESYEKIKNKSDPTCSPYPELSSTLNLPPCKELRKIGENDVCAFFYGDNGDKNGMYRNYGMKTFSSFEEAMKNNVIVTHRGACGVCSNSNDLSIYLKRDLEERAYSCSLLPFPGRVYDCYRKIGFTNDCAWVWTGNTLNTAKQCLWLCLSTMTKPKSDPETCELNKCYQCDETMSGPIFKAYSGRTRRNSGMVSNIVRECSTIANIRQDPEEIPQISLIERK